MAWISSAALIFLRALASIWRMRSRLTLKRELDLGQGARMLAL